MKTIKEKIDYMFSEERNKIELYRNYVICIVIFLLVLFVNLLITQASDYRYSHYKTESIFKTHIVYAETEETSESSELNIDEVLEQIEQDQEQEQEQEMQNEVDNVISQSIDKEDIEKILSILIIILFSIFVLIYIK